MQGFFPFGVKKVSLKQKQVIYFFFFVVAGFVLFCFEHTQRLGQQVKKKRESLPTTRLPSIANQYHGRSSFIKLIHLKEVCRGRTY